MTNNREPVGIALLFCDHIIEEKNSNKKSLIGVFSVILGEKFPLQFRPFWLYVSFTNLVGEHTFAINMVLEKTKNVIFSAGGNVDSRDPDAVIELPLPVRPVVFPEPGEYGVTLHIDGSPLLNRILYVKVRG